MQQSEARAIGAAEYDRQWSHLDDFIKYNPGSRHRRRWIIATLKKEAKHRPIRSLLDVGCGNSELLRSILAQAPVAQLYAGVDLSSTAVEQNRRAVPQVQFEVLNIETGALARTFDMIVCSEVIEHLEDRSKAFAHITQMLSPGGRLILTCPTGPVFATERFFGHVTHPTVAEIERLASQCGLVVKRVELWGWPFYRALKWATNVKSDWALKKFGTVSYSWGARLVSQALYLLNFLNLSNFKQGCQLYAVLERQTPV